MGWEIAAGVITRALCWFAAMVVVAAWRWLRRKPMETREPLSADLRRRLAVELRREGWSVRAITDRLGCSETTVRRDLAKSDLGKLGS